MKINVVRSVPSLLPVFLVLAVALVVGCGPARVMPLDNVGPNETAFVIPLEGNGTEQEKFESIKYLEGRKVASKRIEIPVRQRDTGYGWWNYEYVPMVRVVKVDRSLVTREWVIISPPCARSARKGLLGAGRAQRSSAAEGAVRADRC